MVLRRTIPNRPRFRLRWLARRDGGGPTWITDPAWVPPGERRMYSRIKEGLRAVLERIDGGGVVLLPAYVPPGVVTTALAAGFEVRYYPVEADLSLPVEAVESRLRAHSPAAVLFVHYLGFADDRYPEIEAVAREVGAVVVEDCARSLFSRDRAGRLLGSTGDVALYCVHKTLPAPNGGLVVSRNGSLPQPTGRERELGDFARAVGASFAERVGFCDGWRPGPVEMDRPTTPGAHPPARELLEPGWLSERAFRLSDPARIRAARAGRYRELRRRLLAADVDVVTPSMPRAASPYGVGVLAPSEAARDRLYDALLDRRLPGQVLTWPPVHRDEEVLDEAGAMALRRRLVVLPTHDQVPEPAVARIADCVEEHVG